MSSEVYEGKRIWRRPAGVDGKERGKGSTKGGGKKTWLATLPAVIIQSEDKEAVTSGGGKREWDAHSILSIQPEEGYRR